MNIQQQKYNLHIIQQKCTGRKNIFTKYYNVAGFLNCRKIFYVFRKKKTFNLICKTLRLVRTI